MRKLWKKMKNKQGFTLMEMLIVVAIIAVLVAIAIPVYQGQVHKAKVAADWANLRAYYAEIQADYITRGEYNSAVPVFYPDPGQTQQTEYATITFLNGDEVKLQAGNFLVHWHKDGGGYQIAYNCDNYAEDHIAAHELVLG